MITPTYIAQDMVRSGYASDEDRCKRLLTDWRQKGLLPELKEKGRQHHGKIHYWDDPEIANQAITVYKLFKIYHRSEWVILSTWFAGYYVSPNKVREIWAKNLQVLINDFKKQIRRNEEMGDVLSRLDRQIQRKHKKSPFIRHEYFMSLLSNIFFNHEYRFEDFDDETEIKALLTLFSITINNNKDLIEARIGIKTITQFLNQHCSLTARNELIKSCSDQILLQVHSDWRKAKNLLLWIYQIFSSNSSELSNNELKFMIFVGNSFIFIALIMNKIGCGSKFIKALNECSDFLISIDVIEMRDIIQDPSSIYDDERFINFQKKIVSLWENTPMDEIEKGQFENPRI